MARVGGKCRQVYLNNNNILKMILKNRKSMLPFQNPQGNYKRLNEGTFSWPRNVLFRVVPDQIQRLLPTGSVILHYKARVIEGYQSSGRDSGCFSIIMKRRNVNRCSF